MNITDFESLRADIEIYQRSLLSIKAKEYADPNGDRLANFKDGALLEGRFPEEYLRSLQIKHLLSVKKLIIDMVNHDKIAPFEMWREKLIDINTYNVLLLGLIKERLDKRDKENKETTNVK